MKKTSYLNETQKYEIWKADFSKKMQDLLSDLFDKYLGYCNVTIYNADKWNIEFKVTVAELEDLNKIRMDLNLQEAVEIKEINEFYLTCDCKINAKTEKDLDIKLACIRLLA